jgi:4-amino-4-deoxy-L-arabinose transferase-like glycosyltransferase
MSTQPLDPTMNDVHAGGHDWAGPTGDTHGQSSAALRRWIWAILLAGLALLAAHALTKQPHTDEGDLASTATSLLDRGRIAFPMSYDYGPTVRDVYYLAPPFYPAALAAWFAPFGRSLVSYRLFHVAWVLLLVVSWMRVVRRGSTTGVSLAFAAGLLAFNYDILNLGVSRYDIVCAALNAAAMAAYLTWRANRFGRAIVVANVCLALSALTHPYAVFGLLGCLALVLAYGDWRRLRVRHVLLGLAPYVVAFGAWIVMIGGHWDVMREQIAMQASTRVIDYGNPLRVVASDFVARWWELFAGWREGVPRIMRVKTLFLVLWAVVPVLALRRRSAAVRPARIGVVAYTLSALLILPFTDNMHVQIYNVHVIAGLTALTAMAAADAWELWPRLRPAVLVAVAGICLFGVFAIAFRVRQRELQREYQPVQALLEREVGAQDLVIAPSELGFGLGFERHVRDDPALSSLNQGQMPKLIVEAKERNEPAPDTVPCAGGSTVHDTTAYVEAPVHTPRDSYRVLMRVSPGDSAVTSSAPVLRIARNCGA